MMKTHRIDEEDDCDLGWDLSKYDCWWQDPDYRPDLATKAEMAEIAGVSLKTIDDWIRKGAPVYRKGSNGIGYEIAVGPFMEWHRAREMGVSILEYRRRQLDDVKKRKEAERVRNLESENKRLRRELREVRSELRLLRREVRERRQPGKQPPPDEIPILHASEAVFG